MPCGAWGSSVSETSPPSSSISFTVRSKTSRTPASIPSASPASSRGTPNLQPLQVLAARQLDPALDPDRGRVAGVASLQRPQQQRGVGDVARQRAALVERGGEGDLAVARDRAVGGLHADDPAQGRGLADRAAGVGPDRAGRQAAGDGRRRPARGAARDARRCPTGSSRRRRPSSRSTSPSRTRPCSSCRARSRRPRPACGRRSRCRAARSPRGSSSPRWWRALRAEDVLDRHGDPGELPVAPGRPVLGRPQVRVQLVAGRGVAVGAEVLVGGELAGADLLGRLGDGEFQELSSRLGLRGGDAEGAVGGIGRGLQRLLARPARTRLIRAQHVLQLDHVRVGSTPSRSSSEMRSTCSRMPAQLRRHALDLVFVRRSRASRATWRTWSRSITAGILGGWATSSSSCASSSRTCPSSASGPSCTSSLAIVGVVVPPPPSPLGRRRNAVKVARTIRSLPMSTRALVAGAAGAAGAPGGELETRRRGGRQHDAGLSVEELVAAVAGAVDAVDAACR